MDETSSGSEAYTHGLVAGHRLTSTFCLGSDTASHGRLRTPQPGPIPGAESLRHGTMQWWWMNGAGALSIDRREASFPNLLTC